MAACSFGGLLAPSGWLLAPAEAFFASWEGSGLCLLCSFEGLVDIWADILFAHQLIEAILGQYGAHVVVDSREDNLDVLLL